MMRVKVWSFLGVLLALLLVASAFETATDQKDEKKSDVAQAKVSSVEDVKTGGGGKGGGDCSGGGPGGGGCGSGGGGGPGGSGGKGGSGGSGGGGGGGCGYSCCGPYGCKKCCAAGANVYVVIQEPEKLEDAKNVVLGGNSWGGGGGGGGCQRYCCGGYKGGYCSRWCCREDEVPTKANKP